jgi:ribonucleoside-diphosphate reductase alpha chain
VTKGWFMFATPLLSNGGTTRTADLLLPQLHGRQPPGINDHYEETSYLSSLGGGVGGFIGVRSNNEGTSKGSASSGATPFVCVIDRYMLAFSQGKTRRGSYAAYLDISHPEIKEFLNSAKHRVATPTARR